MMRILIADDQLAVGEALGAALSVHYLVEDVLQDPREVFGRLEGSSVDIILLDSTLPHCDLYEMTRKIRRQYPQIRVVVMTMFVDSSEWPALHRMGASGCVSKAVSLSEFIHCLDDIATRTSRLPAGERRSPKGSLRSRHLDLITEKSRGASRKQIAASLGLSAARLDELVAELKDLTGAHEWTDLVLHAVERGGIEPRVPTRRDHIPSRSE